VVDRLLANALDAFCTNAVLVFVCLAVVGMMNRSRGGHAVEILKERYARGEINQIEFEERRRLLEA
jgi:uncharacterized membrane protein